MSLLNSSTHKDENLRKELENHLDSLVQQKLILPWNSRDISPGGVWAKEIDTHLKSARIILLLVSSDFLASGYCYGVEVQEAMRKHEAGEARVIPIILRPCDWEHTPFGKLQALPKDGKAVMVWTNRDQALTNVAKGLRRAIDELRAEPSAAPKPATSKPRRKTREEVGGTTTMTMPEIPKTPAHLSNPLKKAIDRYYKELKGYVGKAEHELALRSAFQNLLADVARSIKWTLFPEQTIEGGIRPCTSDTGRCKCEKNRTRSAEGGWKNHCGDKKHS